jgi:DinB superfamily
MAAEASSPRAAALAALLRERAELLIAVIEPIDADRWMAVPTPGVWSIGKDAAHVAEATFMHRWIVHRSVGHKVPSRRPGVERKEMTTDLSPADMVALLRRRTEEGASLILDLTHEQLDLPTRPPRARGQLLGETIERVLIGHYDTHRAEIEAKLRALG